MAWFKKRSEKKSPERVHDTRVAVVIEKEASKEVAEKAKQATKTLNELLEANQFTIKIYRAVRDSNPEAKVKRRVA